VEPGAGAHRRAASPLEEAAASRVAVSCHRNSDVFLWKTILRRSNWGLGKRHDYFCRSRYPRGKGCGARSPLQSVVDGAIERILTTNLTKPLLLLKILDSMKRNAPNKDGDGLRIERELAKLEAKRKRVLDAILDALVSKQEYTEHLRKIESNRHEL
jgi:hypothetical protein